MSGPNATKSLIAKTPEEIKKEFQSYVDAVNAINRLPDRVVDHVNNINNFAKEEIVHLLSVSRRANLRLKVLTSVLSDFE